MKIRSLVPIVLGSPFGVPNDRHEFAQLFALFQDLVRFRQIQQRHHHTPVSDFDAALAQLQKWMPRKQIVAGHYTVIARADCRRGLSPESSFVHPSRSGGYDRILFHANVHFELASIPALCEFERNDYHGLPEDTNPVVPKIQQNPCFAKEIHPQDKWKVGVAGLQNPELLAKCD